MTNSEDQEDEKGFKMNCSDCHGERVIPVIDLEGCFVMCEKCRGFGSAENKEKYKTRFKSLMAKAIIEVTMDKELRDLSDAWIDFRCSEIKNRKFLSYDECGECYECKKLTKAMNAILNVLERNLDD